MSRKCALQFKAPNVQTLAVPRLRTGSYLAKCCIYLVSCYITHKKKYEMSVYVSCTVFVQSFMQTNFTSVIVWYENSQQETEKRSFILKYLLFK